MGTSRFLDSNAFTYCHTSISIVWKNDKSSVTGAAVSSHVESLIKRRNLPHTFSNNKPCYIIVTFGGTIYVMDTNLVFVYQTLLTVNFARCILLGSSPPTTTTEPPKTESGKSILTNEPVCCYWPHPLPSRKK